MVGAHRRAARLITIALLAAALAAISATGQGTAQGTPGQPDGIVVTGIGIATGPASAAALQVLIGSQMYGSPQSQPLASTELEPIIDAIMAAGVAESDIAIFNPASTSMFTGPGGPGGAMLRFDLPDPTDAGMAELVATLYDASATARLSLQHIGVHYETDDCATLQQEASDAAVADARVQAEFLANSLGAELGALTQAMDSSFLYGGLPDSCGTSLSGFGQYGPGMDQPFDASVPVEASVTTQLTLTFEMSGGDAATPAST